ncbi:MAG TPA: alpha/beta hydrolase domain-containing protein [Acidimicrobiales bacterium]|nr:alpha/beta hydrolase domain-containing protein [Acidimicrobiales bacterium]
MTAVEPARAAALRGPITAGRIVEPVCPIPVDLEGHGYVEEEFFASGTAVAYRPSAPLTPDGRWTAEPVDEAPYATRIVVRRPVGAERSSGTVLVEWCNVSGGVEAAAEWSYLHEEILRSGHAYVAVSAQALGVDGGAPLLEVPGVRPRGGLVGRRPERYGALGHPGDRFAFDLFSQVGWALRADGDPPPLGDLPVHRVLAMGESQSAFFLTTYLNAIHPRTAVYEGFLVHSRGGSAASLSGEPGGDDAVPDGVHIREDVGAPVLIFETETDLGALLRFVSARQPDSGHIRTWEVAGTAHADAYIAGAYAPLLGCDFAVNSGPHHEVVQAALHALVHWVTEGSPPPVAPPLELASTSPPLVARDELGNARGGVRTPDVEAPVATLSGEAPEGASTLCMLFGSTIPFDGATLRRLYGDEAGYLLAYEAALGAAVAAGFLLPADCAAMRARAERFVFPE